MHPVAPHVLGIAETLNLYLPPPPDEERVIGPQWCAFVGSRDVPACNVVQRIQIRAEEVERVVADVRELFRRRGRSALTWEISASTRPVDLHARLLSLGMVPDDEPEIAGMVLRRPLPEHPGHAEHVVVRPVETLEDFRAHGRVYHRCFGRSGEAPPDELLDADYERRRGREPQLKRWLAWDGETPVAAADAVFVDGAVVLAGGATIPEARGQGAYRALLRARWQEAVARGTPVLVVQAGRMSRPILERLGFEEVARVQVLLDRIG